MGFLKRLFRVGATAGATVAAMKVAEKYKKNIRMASETSTAMAKWIRRMC